MRADGLGTHSGHRPSSAATRAVEACFPPPQRHRGPDLTAEAQPGGTQGAHTARKGATGPRDKGPAPGYVKGSRSEL